MISKLQESSYDPLWATVITVSATCVCTCVTCVQANQQPGLISLVSAMDTWMIALGRSMSLADTVGYGQAITGASNYTMATVIV